MSDPVADAIQELQSITRCQCEPAWTDRGKHAVECVAYCREDVDVLAATVSERDEALSLLRELSDWADLAYRDVARPDGAEVIADALAFVDRASEGDQA